MANSARIFSFICLNLLGSLILYCLWNVTAKPLYPHSKWIPVFKSAPLPKIHLKPPEIWCTANGNQTTGKRVLSYTIFGTWAGGSKWHSYIGLIAKEAFESNVYHDWTVRVYHDDTLRAGVRKNLMARHPNLMFCDVSHIPQLRDESYINGMEWRFIPIGDPSLDIMCSRDIDSPLTKREFLAVDQWLKSDKFFHILRDGRGQFLPILGGLFCVRIHANRTLATIMHNLLQKHAHLRDAYGRQPAYNSDQDMLARYIWPIVRHSVMQHDAYFCEKYSKWTVLPFPSQRIPPEWLGCKRPCNNPLERWICPIDCRPAKHKDWSYC